MKFEMNFLKVLIAFIFAASICLCVNAKPRAYMVFDSEPITTKTVPKMRPVFRAGQRIHYAILCDKGFRGDTLKVQIIQKDEKSEFWGYTPLTNREVELNNSHFYIDYLVLHNKGHYLVQVFELKNLQSPIGYGEFWVEDK